MHLVRRRRNSPADTLNASGDGARKFVVVSLSRHERQDLGQEGLHVEQMRWPRLDEACCTVWVHFAPQSGVRVRLVGTRIQLD